MAFQKKLITLLLTTVAISLTACGKKFETAPSADISQVSTSSNPLEAEKEWKEQKQEAVASEKGSKVLLNESELVDFTDEVLPSDPVALKKENKISADLGQNADFCKPENKELNSTKKYFVCSILPSAIRMNKQIYKQRLLILDLEKKDGNKGLSAAEEKWLSKIKMQYGLTEDSSFSDLLSRVDIVPLALLVTQASIESGWGTSRASKEAKNLFGVHGSFKKDNCLPALKNPNVCIKKYASYDQSIGDYLQFLNTKKSTQGFRNKRKLLRQQNKKLDPVVLASTLTTYSELGVQYIQQVVSMMKKQNFVSLIFNEEEVEAEHV